MLEPLPGFIPIASRAGFAQSLRVWIPLETNYCDSSHDLFVFAVSGYLALGPEPEFLIPLREWPGKCPDLVLFSHWPVQGEICSLLPFPDLFRSLLPLAWLPMLS